MEGRQGPFDPAGSQGGGRQGAPEEVSSSAERSGGVLGQRSPSEESPVPGDGLPSWPCCPLCLAGSSPWEMWPQCESGGGFEPAGPPVGGGPRGWWSEGVTATDM